MLKRNFVLIGAPDDHGVAIVGGRVGAKEGPAAIRKELEKLGVKTYQDAGDITIQSTQEETYLLLREKIRKLHQSRSFPIVIGGGHDLSFGSLSGFLDAYPGGGIVNIDPHLDCRPIAEEGKIPSGSPYRLLLERTSLKGKQLMEFGYQMHCNTQENLGYLKERGVQLIPWPASLEQSLRPFAESVASLAVSFDIDSIQSEFAPGVSAPAKVGHSAEEALALVQAIKRFPNLKHFEIMEMNPRFDPDGRTAKLAAQLLSEFLVD